MKELVASFTDHLQEALEIAATAAIRKPINPVHNVVVLGLGGSGIGGSIAAEVLSGVIKVPVTSCKDYSMPGHVSENTLVIASSYSGNTEETLSALAQVAEKTNMVYCVCSGGKLADWAERNDRDCIHIPSGFPPRAAFGYSFPQLFKILSGTGLISTDYSTEFINAVELLNNETNAIRSEAKKAAEILKDKMAVIYTATGYEGVAVRFRQQINENSKKLCWHHVLPEMNHNELVGWREENEKLAVIFFHNADDHKRTAKRMELSEKIISDYTSSFIHLHSKGANRLERSLYLIHLGDWISVEIAALNNMDAVEVNVITGLKDALSKF